MAAPTTGVLGSFVHVDAAVDAIRALKAQGHTDLTVYSPAPNHEIEEALDHPVSPVRLFTLIGGRKAPYRERFSDDQIGVFVPCRADQAAAVEGLLQRAGSVEVSHAA